MSFGALMEQEEKNLNPATILIQDDCIMLKQTSPGLILAREPRHERKRSLGRLSAKGSADRRMLREYAPHPLRQRHDRSVFPDIQSALCQSEEGEPNIRKDCREIIQSPRKTEMQNG